MQDEVSRDVVVDAPAEEVWRSLTEPERLAEWLAEEVRLELEPGGDLELRMPDGSERHGFVDEVEPPRRLRFFWREGDAELSEVEVTLEEAEGGTRVRVVESRPLALLDARGVDLGAELGAYPPAPEASASPVLMC
jgi:uncharacterized protein YndB with AHSA1/START domain